MRDLFNLTAFYSYYLDKIDMIHYDGQSLSNNVPPLVVQRFFHDKLSRQCTS